jgi:hypothetical protein
MIVFDCACGAKLQVKDEHGGRKVKCPTCGNELRAPRRDEPPHGPEIPMGGLVREIRRNPSKHGMGRAIFGIIMGALGTLVLLTWLAAVAVQLLQNR